MRPRVIAALVGALAAHAAGCRLEWDSAAPPFSVEGTPPSLAALPKLNSLPAGRASLLTGSDGAAWVAFCEFWTGGGGTTISAIGRGCKRMHLVRAEGAVAGAGESVAADEIALHRSEVYLTRDAPTEGTRTITLHHPGDPAIFDASFLVPPGKRGFHYTNDAEGADPGVFVYWVRSAATTSFDVYRRDGRYHRRVPVPAGVDPEQPEETTGFELLLTSDSGELVVREPGGRLSILSTLDESALRLGVRSGMPIGDAAGRLITAGADGLRAVPLDGGDDRVLYAGDVPADTVVPDGDLVWFVAAGGLWRVRADGSSPALRVEASAARLIALGPHGELATSRDPRNRYIGGAGDGWVGGRRLMERGRRLRFSRDGARVRFLEHAATVGVVGDLVSAPLGGAAPTPLGVNVHVFDELLDGRVIAVENAVYAGSWNRLVVIDEAAGTKRWLAPAAVDFVRVPRTSEIIADVVSGASGYDLVRIDRP